MTSRTSRYAAAHDSTNLNGPGDGRPTAQQIVDDNNLNNNLTGKVALVTGCSSGIGIETARALKSTGATVYVTVRDPNKGQKALADILEPGKLEMLTCDQNSLASVEAAAKSLLDKTSTLNILINNAGIMAIPTRELTQDGHESQFGVNHLAHFLLFQRLKSTLLSSATPDFPSRVVCVSSSGHKKSPPHFDDLKLEQNYDPWTSYGQAKTSNIYMANEIERRYGALNLHAFSLHPGGIWTGLQTHMDTSKLKGNPEVERVLKSVEQGAATSLWAAVGGELKGMGGLYLEDCGVARTAEEVAGMKDGRAGYAEHAYDEGAEGRLWRVSCELVGVSDD